MRKHYKYVAIVTIALFLIAPLGCEPINQPDDVNTSSEIENEIPEWEDKEGTNQKQHEEVSPTGETIPTEEVQLEEPQTITITAVGDIMCHNSNLESAFNPETGKYDFTKAFEHVKEYIEHGDLAIANLETVTAGEEEKYTSFPYFNTPDSILEALKYAGFDVLVTANNHALDRKKDGVLRTIEKINENGMIHVGTLAKPEDERFITVDVKGFKVSIIAYSYSCNGNSPFLSEEERKYMLNLIDEEKIKEDIKSAKEIDSDVIIAYMHWGNEYHRTPNVHQEELASKIFDWGADIILGTHPHVIQKSEVLEVEGKDRYIIYSMGNFISNFRREDQAERPNKIYTEDGVIVRITLEKRNENGEEQTIIKSVKHIPTWVDKFYENGRSVHKILPVLKENMEKNFINDNNREKASDSYDHTMELMTQFGD
ncbi:CapA family protein [Herbivorax sp. ANBcel31]|uniref:CapA family protein n=1 Tax=Herbivorax sp. ANBcel31 TaxID=3069754 RepID=UPI0027AED60A|nr:CapA family protein [Herbivorax sp. ANBcel31]MDQ2086116.1 CapA family protein [Herbivorax sp. ANBcel31]